MWKDISTLQFHYLIVFSVLNLNYFSKASVVVERNKGKNSINKNRVFFSEEKREKMFLVTNLSDNQIFFFPGLIVTSVVSEERTICNFTNYLQSLQRNVLHHFVCCIVFFCTLIFILIEFLSNNFVVPQYWFNLSTE